MIHQFSLSWPLLRRNEKQFPFSEKLVLFTSEWKLSSYSVRTSKRIVFYRQCLNIQIRWHVYTYVSNSRARSLTSFKCQMSRYKHSSGERCRWYGLHDKWNIFFLFFLRYHCNFNAARRIRHKRRERGEWDPSARKFLTKNGTFNEWRDAVLKIISGAVRSTELRGAASLLFFSLNYGLYYRKIDHSSRFPTVHRERFSSFRNAFER